jgi:hypothetical protein
MTDEELRKRRNEYMREWAAKNKEHLSAQRRKRYIKNRDKIKEQARKCYEKNKEKRREYGKRWREMNSEKMREGRRQWYEKNKQLTIDRAKEWVNKNPTKRELTRVKDKLKRQGFPEIGLTRELVETKGLVLKIKRLIKSKQNGS